MLLAVANYVGVKFIDSGMQAKKFYKDLRKDLE